METRENPSKSKKVAHIYQQSSMEEDTVRAKSPMSARKNSSSLIASTIAPSEDKVIAQNASTLFERQSHLGVMKETLSSPYIRRSFKGDDKGHSDFL